MQCVDGMVKSFCMDTCQKCSPNIIYEIVSICNCFCQLINVARYDTAIAGCGCLVYTGRRINSLFEGYVLRDPFLYLLVLFCVVFVFLNECKLPCINVSYSLSLHM
jgi:hypothetical protein